MPPIKVLLVDDHALVRGMLHDRLGRETDIEVVGTARDADEAITAARATPPDIIVMDIDMPGLICFDAAHRIAAEHPDMRLIFLSAYTHDRYIEQALAVGAMAYLTKAEPPETVVNAIRKVSQGQACFSKEIQDRMVAASDGTKLTGQAATMRTGTLTARENEVLQYIARGHSKKEIAGIMKVSVKTVDNHAFHLMNKLGIHNRVELARFAIREGIANV